MCSVSQNRLQYSPTVILGRIYAITLLRLESARKHQLRGLGFCSIFWTLRQECSHVSKIGGVHVSFLSLSSNVQLQPSKASRGKEWGGAYPPHHPTIGSLGERRRPPHPQPPSGSGKRNRSKSGYTDRRLRPYFPVPLSHISTV